MMRTCRWNSFRAVSRFGTAFRIALTAVVASALAFPVTDVIGGDPRPMAASEGVGVATSAAEAWSPDARLVYLENDEPIDGNGTAPRWGYLFYSADLDQVRGYSVEKGKIVGAGDPGLRFEAPPLHGSWIDSARALALADTKEGAKFREKQAGAPATMLLMRGAFDEKKPDRTCWMVIYEAETPGVPSLFVVVDAVSGDVVRTWRG